MMIARWSIEAKFGHKMQALEMMQRWMREIGSQIGWSAADARIVTGSIGARESTIETEIRVKDLSQLDSAWDKLAKIAAHKDWGKEFEPYVVSGTSKWEIFRVVE